jgi:hypothetical protein
MKEIMSRLLRRMFGMNWQETGDVHNEELHNLYSSPKIIETMKCAYENVIGRKEIAWQT